MSPGRKSFNEIRAVWHTEMQKKKRNEESSENARSKVCNLHGYNPGVYATVFPASLRPGSDFMGRCRGVGSVTDPHRWSWEAVVKVYTVTKGRCRAANIRSVARNVLSRHHREPEALVTRLSLSIVTMQAAVYQGRYSNLLLDDRHFSHKFHLVSILRKSIYSFDPRRISSHNLAILEKIVWAIKRENLPRGLVSMIGVGGRPSADNLNVLRYRTVDDRFQSVVERTSKGPGSRLLPAIEKSLSDIITLIFF